MKAATCIAEDEAGGTGEYTAGLKGAAAANCSGYRSAKFTLPNPPA